ncbi:hypothetical protein CR513_18003, partial [Mucuna pruriens]
MEAFLKVLDLWKAIEENYDSQRKKKTRKAKACLFASVSQTIFTRIVTLKSMKRMKESNKLLGIANKMRLLGSDFADSRIVEKILVIMPERYETSITSLENTKDLSKITLAKVLHALQAQEQRRLMRKDHVVEGALPAKHHNKYFKKNKPIKGKNSANNQNKGKGQRKNYPFVSIAEKWVTHRSDVGKDQTQSVVSKST